MFYNILFAKIQPFFFKNSIEMLKLCFIFSNVCVNFWLENGCPRPKTLFVVYEV